MTCDCGKMKDFRKKPQTALTHDGASQLFELGKMLRKLYSSLVPSIEDENAQKSLQESVYNVSTPTERTVESLQAVLKGMLQPEACNQSDSEPQLPTLRINVLDKLEENYLFAPYTM